MSPDIVLVEADSSAAPPPLGQGSYVSLGMLNTMGDWSNAAIAVGALALILGGNWAYSKAVQSSADRRRQKALEELEGKSD